MKKLIVAIVLIAGLAAVAFASLGTAKKKTVIEKKMQKPDKKRVCKHSCMFS
jgi:hypothetical protein